MKIGIIGTHGVGKTTICQSFADYYENQSYKFRYKIIPEVARDALARGLPLNTETTLDAQLAIQYLHAVEELAAEHKMLENDLDIVICDRTRIDSYIYAYNKFGSKAKDLMYEDVLRWSNEHPYNILFKIPIYSKDIAPDGIRSIDRKFQQRIDVLIDEFVKDNNIIINNMPTELFLSNIEERPALLHDYLNKTFSNLGAYNKHVNIFLRN